MFKDKLDRIVEESGDGEEPFPTAPSSPRCSAIEPVKKYLRRRDAEKDEEAIHEEPPIPLLRPRT